MGRRKKEISPEDMRKAEKYARDGHKNGTICELMGWDREWLDQRPDILTKLTKMRALRKDDILKDQNRIRRAKGKQMSAAATMAIWHGKNELDQTDKTETKINGGEMPLLVIIGRSTDAGKTSPDNPA